MTEDNLRAELAAWKTTRRNYPGWLVLPSVNRRHLLHDIERSLHHGELAHGLVWDLLSDWPAENRLEAWAEFNWRMERALLPLRPEWVQKIEAVLGSVDNYAVQTSVATR